MKSYEAKRSKVRRELKKIVDESPSHVVFTRVGSKLLVFFHKGWEFVIEPKWNLGEVDSLLFHVRILRTEDGVEKLSTIYDSKVLVITHIYAWIRESE